MMTARQKTAGALLITTTAFGIAAMAGLGVYQTRTTEKIFLQGEGERLMAHSRNYLGILKALDTNDNAQARRIAERSLTQTAGDIQSLEEAVKDVHSVFFSEEEKDALLSKLEHQTYDVDAYFAFHGKKVR